MKCQLEQRDKVSLEQLQRDAGWASSGTMAPRPEDRDSLASWPWLALTRREGMGTNSSQGCRMGDFRHSPSHTQAVSFYFTTNGIFMIRGAKI